MRWERHVLHIGSVNDHAVNCLLQPNYEYKRTNYSTHTSVSGSKASCALYSAAHGELIVGLPMKLEKRIASGTGIFSAHVTFPKYCCPPN